MIDLDCITVGCFMLSHMICKPVLENFCRPFFRGPTDHPSVSEDGWNRKGLDTIDDICIGPAMFL